MNPEAFPGHIVTRQNREAGLYLRDLAQGPIDTLIVLGSGLAETLNTSTSWPDPLAAVPLSSIPGIIAPVADGHLDQFRIYRLPSATVGVAMGRTHLYEGIGPDPVTALARAAFCAGINTAILCNANGCLRNWNLGDVVAIEDHLNLTGMSPFDGTVFLDTTTCWDPPFSPKPWPPCVSVVGPMRCCAGRNIKRGQKPVSSQHPGLTALECRQ